MNPFGWRKTLNNNVFCYMMLLFLLSTEGAVLAWVAVLLPLVSIMLLTLMIRRHEASRITSLFFPVPPVTALVAWLVPGETMGPVFLAGMSLAVAGVALVVSGNHRARA